MTDYEEGFKEHLKKRYFVDIEDGLERWEINVHCPTYIDPVDGIYANRLNGPNQLNIEGDDFYTAWSKEKGAFYKREYGPTKTTDKGMEYYGEKLTGNDGVDYYDRQ